MTTNTVSNSLGRLDDLREIVGPTHVLTGEDVSSRWDGYPLGDPMKALCIVRPGSVFEVSAVLAYCDKAGLKVVPQGGRTGMSGGARTSPDDVALSLERLRSIGTIDKTAKTVCVEAGVPLQALQDAARDVGLYYPVDLGARGSATIGGTISTNAGGNSVFRFGMTREQVLGLEVVLADGTVLSSMNQLIKNNTGYDLKQLFVGAEGTLGVVTRAVLRLRSHPGQRATAFVGLQRFEDVLSFMILATDSTDGALTSFEVMWRSFLDTVLNHSSHASPLSRTFPFYVLIEIVSSESTPILEHVLGLAWDRRIVADAVIAQREKQASAFWAIRDDIDALVTALEPVFLYDVSLPQISMEAYVAALSKQLSKHSQQARLVVFGHIADGNLHLFICTGTATDHHEVDEIVYDLLRPLNGSISAEHGIGLEKRPYLDVSRSAEELAAMRRLKAAFDPNGTMNPGKIL
jgi:FAD/FMN-containing dehydrogenase